MCRNAGSYTVLRKYCSLVWASSYKVQRCYAQVRPSLSLRRSPYILLTMWPEQLILFIEWDQLLLLPHYAIDDIIKFNSFEIHSILIQLLFTKIMPFRPEQFRLAIADNSSKHLLIFLKQVIFALKHDKEPAFLVRVMSQLAAVLKDQGESPVLKFKSIRFIMYLIILGEVEVYENLKEELYPILRNACLYNRAQPLITRGMDFFKNNKYTSIATFDQKAKIKNIGCKYINFCLQCVYVLGSWLPTEPSNKNEKSLFLISYEALIKEGVQFPDQNDFTFFNEERIQQIENQIKQCQQNMDKAHEEIDNDYFESLRSRNDAEMMNGVEYLQRRLKQKDKIISDLKYNNSMNDINRQSVIQKFRDQQYTYIHKIQSYQQKITELTDQVKNMKFLLSQTDTQEIKRNQQTIKQLHMLVDKLTLQNQQLKQQLLKNSEIVSAPSLEKHKTLSSRHISPKEKHYNYLKELLQIQTQPNQCEMKIKRSPQARQEFFSYKEAKECFMPYFQTLSREQQIRLRKSLLKSKQVLFKNRQFEVGVITTLSNQIEIDLIIIITNLSEKLLYLHQVTYDYTNDIEIMGIQNSKVGKRKLKSGEQHKQEMKIVVNNIDARCIVMIVQYQQELLKEEKVALILPISKFKLVKIQNFTSSPKESIQVQRVITYEKKILHNLQKIKDYFPKCYIEAGSIEKSYNLKCQLLQTMFFASFIAVGDDALRVLLKFKPQNRCLGEKLLNQFLFILSK